MDALCPFFLCPLSYCLKHGYDGWGSILDTEGMQGRKAEDTCISEVFVELQTNSELPISGLSRVNNNTAFLFKLFAFWLL
jgi:hypothetical protein